MAETGAGRRRGRREAGMDAALPEHRVAFASRLRDLRRECGQPTYRTMSELAHCSLASLSGAAAGRRLPTWEATRGYVTACFRHAGRPDDLEAALRPWRRAWDEASALEKAHRVTVPDAAPPPAATRPRRLGRPAAALVVLVLLATMAGAGARPPAPVPMAGLFNILVMPSASLPALESTLARELGQWARDEPIVAVRGPDGVDPAPDASLARTGEAHGADVVLGGRLDRQGDLWTMTIEVVLTDRLFSETPEFAGRHEISLTEPADVIRGNLEVNRQLAGDAVRYVRSVVAFVRGLGRYALDDYPGAEGDFRTADRGLSAITSTVHAEVVLLMLGNAVGRAGRYPEAADIFRRALTERPGYARATVGMAEALRAGSRNDPAVLGRALDLYRAALTRPESALLEMKARLGLGLTYQGLSVGGTPRWEQADEQFKAVLRRYRGTPGPTPEAGRQALRLAAEARAGQALSAWMTGRYDRAALGYEEALGMLSRIRVDRPTIRDRELLFLRNLRDVYRAMDSTGRADEIEARIRRAGGEP